MRIARQPAALALAALVAAGGTASADPQPDKPDPQADSPGAQANQLGAQANQPGPQANQPGPQANTPNPQIEKADQLFAEAKALESSNLREACDKYTESLHYNPAAIGTLLNVALCNEKLGRVASAVARFTEARDNARELGLPEHVRAAEDHLATLVPQVPHLAIRLTQLLPDTKVLVDDRVVALAALGDIAIDPGEHVVVVSAPDRLPHRATLVIAPAEHKAIVIPVLARSVTVTSSRRRIGQIFTIAGGAMFGASIGLAFYGLHVHNQQFPGHCKHLDNGIDACDETGQSNNNDARTYGNVATVVGGVGLAVGVAGAVIWYLAPRSSRSPDAAPRVVLDVTADHVGVVALGRF